MPTMPAFEDSIDDYSTIAAENYSQELWFWSAGIWGFSEIAVVVFVSVYLLRRYAAPSVDWASLIFTFIGWFSGFAGSLLLPFDLSRSILKKQYDVSQGATPSVRATSNHNTTPKLFADAVLPNNAEVSAITQTWIFLFWFTFALSWLVIPSLQGFLAAEGFTWHRRLCSSIRQQLISWAITLGIVVVVLIWVIAAGWSLEKFLGMVMALANVYGLLFILMLSTHGLITVPRYYFWERASFDRQLERCHCEAVFCESNAYEADQDMQRCRRKVCKLDNVIAREGDQHPLREYMEAMRARLQISHRDPDTSATPSDSDSDSCDTMASRHADDLESWPSSLDLKILALEKLDAELRTVIFKRDSTRALWRQLVARATVLKYYVEGQNGGPPIQTAQPDDSDDNQEGMPPKPTPSQWRSARLLNTLFFRGLGAMLYLLSWLVLWCEVTVALPWNMSPIGYLVLEALPLGSHWAELAMLVPLAYMSFCTYRSLTLLKIPFVKSYHMHAGRQTHAIALLFNAAYVCRLQFTLGFNFLSTLQIQEQWSATDFNLPDCSFKTVVGRMDVFPLLGSSFSVFFPGVTLLVAAIMYFNIHRKILQYFHVDEIASAVPPRGTAEYEERLREGQLLIHRAVSRRGRHRRRLGSSRRSRRSRSSSHERRRRNMSDLPRSERFKGRRDDAFSDVVHGGKFAYSRV